MKNRGTFVLLGLLGAALCFSGPAALLQTQAAPRPPKGHGVTAASATVQHVLLLSIDGFHAVDLARYVRTNPGSTLATLAGSGVRYPNASTSMPSDSFPGILSMTTGGSARSTGVFYDDSYDRTLLPPGAACPSSAAPGTEVRYDETIDKNLDAVDGGGNATPSSIDPKKLPIDPKTCQPVYPHSFLRANTIFEVARAAGGYTAWSDKHPAYDLLNGPSGQGVMDLYTPEIAADDTTGSITKTEAYDDLKVQAILNEIDGKTHDGQTQLGSQAARVPSLFGMNFQAVSVGQKLAGNGYLDSQATPSAGLADALAHTDASLGKMVAELRARDLLASTVIIVTAKHGQAPIDPAKRQIVPDDTLTNIISTTVAGGGNTVAQANGDDIEMIWLHDSSKTDAVVAQLQTRTAEALGGVGQILAGDSLRLRFNDPASDPRTPDIIVLPTYGVIYAGAKASKLAEHGGFNNEDTNVALLVSNPSLSGTLVTTPVATTEIAPTILSLLGYDPTALTAVRAEGTPLLPGLSLGK